LREVHSPDAPELQAGIAEACAAAIDVAVWLTGVGVRTVFEAASLAGLERQLRQRLDESTVLVRGPKPTAALRQLGVRIDLTAPHPNTTAEVLHVLQGIDLNGKRVLVQLYGAPNPELSQALRERGAHIAELAPYAWERPVDPAPVVALLDALYRGSVDALLITSQAQVENLFRIADEHCREPALAGVAIGAQGPVAEAALRRYGVNVDFLPEHGHMGALVLAAAQHFAKEGVAV